LRPNAKVKLGFYPLPVAEGKRLRNLLAFPQDASASVLDPCVGAGVALHLLTSSAKVERHGVELDGNRAAAAQASGIQTIQGNAFDTVGKAGSFSFLYLNPPYDFEMGPMNNQRMEYLFLDHT
jgi:tRNA1(Val) A37 N6-methylase TrmN6